MLLPSIYVLKIELLSSSRSSLRSGMLDLERRSYGIESLSTRFFLFQAAVMYFILEYTQSYSTDVLYISKNCYCKSMEKPVVCGIIFYYTSSSLSVILVLSILRFIKAILGCSSTVHYSYQISFTSRQRR